MTERNANDIILLYTTFPDQQTAEKICQELVLSRVLACVNIMSPSKSIYWWQGKVEQSNEVPAYLKTTAASYPKLLDRLQGLHPYAVPCLIEIPIDRVNPSYAQWLRSEVLG